MKKVLLFQIDHRSAQDQYRLSEPFTFCRDELFAEGIELVPQNYLRSDEHFDAYIFPRVVRPQVQEYLKHLSSEGKRIAIEMDDDLWHIPEWNPAYPHIREPELARLNWSVDLADMIFVSTPDLASVVNRPEKTVIVPNLVAVGKYPACREHNHDRVRILWAGSAHHINDLKELLTGVEQILAEYGTRVQFLFFGDMPEELGIWRRIVGSNLASLFPHPRYGDKVGYISHVDLTKYIDTLNTIEADIALAPLCDCPFNKSKSSIKYYEYTMTNSVVIATDLPPYRCIDNGLSGFLVQPGENWYKTMKYLIDNVDERRRLVRYARAKVEHKYSWAGSERQKWIEAYKRLAGGT